MTADRRTSWNAAELMAAEFPEQTWAVPGLIADGVTLLAGSPKIGKSFLALNLGAAIASGGRALGKISVDQGDVLYLALEDTGRRLQKRLGVVLAGDPPPERLTLETDCPSLNDGGAEEITEWLGKYPDARLVIVDVFNRIRGKTSDKANRYDADYAALAAVKAIADEWNVPVLVVHHTRKAVAEDFIDSVSGTQGLAGAADAVLVLKRTRGSAEATLRVTGRDIEEADYGLDFAADIGTWRLLDRPVHELLLSDERQRVLAAVRTEPGTGPKRIAELSGVDHDVVRQLVRRMFDDDQIDTDGKGRYFPVSPRSPFTPVSVNGRERSGVNGVNGMQPEPPAHLVDEWDEAFARLGEEGTM